jgi:hypothetical protein
MLLKLTIPARLLRRRMELLCPSSKRGIQLLEVKLIIRNNAFLHLLTSQFPADCGGLWLEEAYCVKAVTASSTATSAASSVTAPAPTQSGIPTTCNAFDVAKDGDGCEIFASRNGITVSQLCQSSSTFE